MSSLGSMNLKNRIGAISIIGIIKIAFIIFVSFSLFTNIITFYEGGSGDDYVYAIVGIDLANGSYGYTNKLWEETGRIEFVPQHWRETNQDVLVPVSSPGIIVTSALSYLIGGYYGLLYLGPIFSILFLIISERVATKLFGSFVNGSWLGIPYTAADEAAIIFCTLFFRHALRRFLVPSTFIS